MLRTSTKFHFARREDNKKTIPIRFSVLPTTRRSILLRLISFRSVNEIPTFIGKRKLFGIPITTLPLLVSPNRNANTTNQRKMYFKFDNRFKKNTNGKFGFSLFTLYSSEIQLSFSDTKLESSRSFTFKGCQKNNSVWVSVRIDWMSEWGWYIYWSRVRVRAKKIRIHNKFRTTNYKLK